MRKRRLSHVDLSYKAKSVKTFDNEVYELKGSIAVNTDNGEIQKVADIYYRVRTAVNSQKHVIAKRKNTNDELQTYRKKY
ncbi:hypothetical protein [Virgibacillus salexigens]|uniref:hypothetical protein n=1 Tax=Virgibacillus massiliensis TaxID=1462526 RepID=UPI001371BB0E|nr:hypothetical protein [Virgibacillus massiliensis]MYL43975.1 hypothetical protein [Virgibacillus massiliensis]